MKQIIGYYSHSRKKFNTKQEAIEHEFIKNSFNAFVVCPNKDLHTENPLEMNLNYYFLFKIHFLVVSGTSGLISKTSFWEVKQAITRNIPIYELFRVGKTFEFRRVVGLKIVNEDSDVKFGKLSTRALPLKMPSFFKQQKKGTPKIVKSITSKKTTINNEKRTIPTNNRVKRIQT